MKKNILLFSLLIFSSANFALEPVYTLVHTKGTNSAYASEGTVEVNNVSWTVEGNMNSDNWWRIGAGKKEVLSKTPRAIYCESLPYTIDSISIRHGKNGSLTIDDFYAVLDNDTIRIDDDNLVSLQTDSAIINLKFTSKNSVPVKFVYTIMKEATSSAAQYIEFLQADFYNTVSDDVPTNLFNNADQNTSKKFLKDGNLIIFSNGKYYNTSGNIIN